MECECVLFRDVNDGFTIFNTFDNWYRSSSCNSRIFFGNLNLTVESC